MTPEGIETGGLAWFPLAHLPARSGPPTRSCSTTFGTAREESGPDVGRCQPALVETVLALLDAQSRFESRYAVSLLWSRPRSFTSYLSCSEAPAAVNA